MKKKTIFESSQQDIFKLSVTILTLFISIMTSLSDNKACYIAILIQACTNFYDYAQFLDSEVYSKNVKSSCVLVLITSVIAFAVSIFALTNTESIPAVYLVSANQTGGVGLIKDIQTNIYELIGSLGGKIFFACVVALPIPILVGDYRINNEMEYLKGEE